MLFVFSKKICDAFQFVPLEGPLREGFPRSMSLYTFQDRWTFSEFLRKDDTYSFRICTHRVVLFEMLVGHSLQICLFLPLGFPQMKSFCCPLPV